MLNATRLRPRLAGLALAFLLSSLAFGTAAAQTAREKALLDSQLHRCFRACARLDGNAFLQLSHAETLVRLYLTRTPHRSDAGGEVARLVEMARGAMLGSFAEFYTDASEAGVSWNQCRIAEIAYSLRPSTGADSDGPRGYSAAVLLHDQWTGQEFAARLTCLLLADTAVVITDRGSVSAAPHGLQAWLRASGADATAQDGETSSPADSSMADPQTEPVRASPVETIVTPNSAAGDQFPRFSREALAVDSFRGRLGNQRTVLLTVGSTDVPRSAAVYDRAGTLVETMTLLPQGTGDGLLLFTTGTALWKLQREGRLFKGRCIHYDRRPDDFLELKPTH